MKRQNAPMNANRLWSPRAQTSPNRKSKISNPMNIPLVAAGVSPLKLPALPLRGRLGSRWMAALPVPANRTSQHLRTPANTSEHFEHTPVAGAHLLLTRADDETELLAQKRPGSPALSEILSGRSINLSISPISSRVRNRNVTSVTILESSRKSSAERIDSLTDAAVAAPLEQKFLRKLNG